MKNKTRLCIGIDCGINTGVAVWDSKEKSINVFSCQIHKAITLVTSIVNENKEECIKVYVEDARLRKWFGNSGKEKLQGAGSVKRDAKIWEDFLKDSGINHEMVAPKNNKTKISSQQFKAITGYKGSTNEHGRDAAMLVFGKI